MNNTYLKQLALSAVTDIEFRIEDLCKEIEALEEENRELKRQIEELKNYQDEQ